MLGAGDGETVTSARRAGEDAHAVGNVERERGEREKGERERGRERGSEMGQQQLAVPPAPSSGARKMVCHTHTHTHT